MLCEAENFPSTSPWISLPLSRVGVGALRFRRPREFIHRSEEPRPDPRKTGRAAGADSEIPSRLWAISTGCEAENFASSFSRLVNRSRARSAARPCTTSCGFEASEPIPFPGADSIFSSRCGAISGRLRFAVRPSRGAIPARETPGLARSRGAPARRGAAAPLPSPREFGPARSRDSGRVRSST